MSHKDNFNSDEVYRRIIVHQYKIEGVNIDEITVETHKKDCLNGLVGSDRLVKKCECKEDINETSDHSENCLHQAKTADSAKRNSIGKKSSSNTNSCEDNLTSTGKQKRCEKSHLNSSVNNQPNISSGDQNNEVSQRKDSINLKCDENMPNAEIGTENMEDNIKNRLRKRIQNTLPPVPLISTKRKKSPNENKKVSVTSDKSSNPMDINDNIKNRLRNRTQNTLSPVPLIITKRKKNPNENRKVNVTSDKSSNPMDINDIILKRNSPEKQDLVEKCHESISDIHKETPQSNLRRSMRILEKSINTQKNNQLDRTGSLSCLSNNEVYSPSTSSKIGLLDNSMSSDVSEDKQGQCLATNRKSRIISNKINEVVNRKINNPLIDAEKGNLVLKPTQKPEGKLKSNVHNRNNVLKDKNNTGQPKKIKSNVAKSQSAAYLVTEGNSPFNESMVQNSPQTAKICEIALKRDEIKEGKSSGTNAFITSHGNCNIEQVKRKLAFESAGTPSEFDKVIEKNTDGETDVDMHVGNVHTSQKRKGVLKNIKQKQVIVKK